MPRLPTVENMGNSPTPSVRGTIPSLNLQTPNLGHEAAATVDLGQAVNLVGKSLAVMAEKEKRELDAVGIEKAATDYLNGQLELELGDKGYTKVLGGDAVTGSLMKDYKQKSKDLRENIFKDLPNQEQQRAFNQRADVADRQYDTGLYRHIAAQSNSYKKETSAGAEETERRNAALNWQQPGTIEQAQLHIRFLVDQRARDEGYHPEVPEQKKVIDTMQAIANTQLHSDVVDMMLMQGKDKAALAYYNQVQKELTPIGAITLGNKVNASSFYGEAMRAVDQVWETKGPKSLNDPIDLEGMDTELRKTYGDQPRILERALSDLQSRAGAHNATQGEFNNSNSAKILERFEAGVSLKELVASQEFRDLPGDQREKLTEYFDNRGWTQQQRARDERRYIDGDKAQAGFGRYWELSNPMVLSAMSENQILALTPELGQTLVGDLMGQKRRMDTPTHLAAATIDSDLFNRIASDAGLPAYEPKPSAKQREQLGRLRNRVETLIGEAQSTVKRPLERDEKEKLMRNEIDNTVMQSKTFGDTRAPAAIIKPEDRGGVYKPIKEIPPAWVGGALNYMRSQGVIPGNMPNSTAQIRFQSRLERAYGHSITGGSAEEGKHILEGRVK